MADAYRGLTIRIGGDTTQLQKALRSANSAISTTQGQLTKMKRALQMDTGNVDAVQKSLELTGQKAVEVSGRLNQLRSALKQVSSQKVELFNGQSTKTIQQIADGTEDVALKASRARDAYNELNYELAKIYQPINKAVDAASKLDEPIDEADAAVKEFAQEWKSVHDTKFTTSDLVKELGLDGAIEKLKELNLITDEEADHLAELQPRWQEAFDENEIAKAANGMRDLEVEITRSEAEVESLVKQFSELSRQSALGDFGEGIDDRLRQIDAAAEQTSQSLREASQALDMDPSNVDAAEAEMRALDDSTRLAAERVTLLEEKLSRMDDAGIGEVADSAQDVALRAQEASDAYEELTRQVVECSGRIEALRDAQSKLDARSMSGTEEYQRLSAEIEDATGELQQLTAQQERAKSAFESSQQVQEYRELEVAIADARSELTELNNQSSSMTSGISSDAWTSLGIALSTSVTPALMAVGSYAIDAANDMDSAYRDMRKTVNATEEEFEDLRQAALDFSTTNVTSADQILSIQAIGGELGIATEDLQTFAETVSNIDVATDLDTEEAAEDLGSLANILDDLTGETMPNFADALVRLGNNGASTESEIADIATRIGSMASIVGMSTPEILAWSSTIASTGQGAEAAGTAIANTISDIEVAVASGGDSLQAFADVAGTSADEFAAAWESDPSAALQSFIEGLNRIEDEGGSAVSTLSDLGITSTRQVQAIQGLMQMIDGLNDNIQMSEDAWNGVSDEWGEAGDAANEASAKAEGFSGALSILQNTAQNLGAEVAEALTPMLQLAADALAAVYDVVSDLPDGMKQAVVAVGALTAALGPAILLFKSVSDFGKDFKTLTTSINAVSTASKNLGSTVSGSGGLLASLGGLKGVLAGLGIAAVVTGITALVAKFAEAKEQAELLDRATNGLADACKVADASMADEDTSAADLSTTISNLEDSNEDTTQSLADLADSFDELNRQTAASISQLGDAYTAVSLYNGQTGLTASQLGEFRTAVETLNSQLGTSYDVVQDAGGAYYVMADGAKVATDTIGDLVDAQIQQIQIEAQMSKLEDLYSSRAEQVEAYGDALGAVTDAQEAYDDAVSRLDDAMANGADWGTINALRGEVDAAQSNIDELNGELDEAKGHLDDTDERIGEVTDSINNMSEGVSSASDSFESFALGSDSINAALSNDQESIKNFAQAVEDSGISLETFSSMGSADLINLAQTWAETGGNITDIANQLGIDIMGSAQGIHDSLTSIYGEDVQATLEDAGLGLDSLSLAMSNAGLSADSMEGISSEAFSRMVYACGGSIDTLVAMIANYNAQPIYEKDGSITVNTTSLFDALGNVYTWNGTDLLDKDGNVVITTEKIETAEGEVYRWNNQGELLDPEGEVVVDYTQLTLANGEMATYENGVLKTKQGHVYVGFDTLTDCNGAMVEYNDTTLKPIEGQVDVDYSDVTDAISYIKSLKRLDGTSVNATVTTTRTTVNRTVNETVSSDASTRSALSALSGASALSAQGMAAASTLASAQMPLASASAAVGDYTVRSSEAQSQQMARLAAEVVKASGNAGRSASSATSKQYRELTAAINGLRNDLDEMGVYLDSGKLVGGISKEMNKSLARVQKRGALSR